MVNWSHQQSCSFLQIPKSANVDRTKYVGSSSGPITIFKRNANAFSLNAFVGVRLRLRRCHEMMFFLNISATIKASNFTIYHNVAHGSFFTFPPEITSQSTSSRQQITQTCQFWVMFGSRFVDKGSTDFEEIYSVVNNGSSASFVVMQVVRHFCFLTPKVGPKWTYRDQCFT